MLAPTLTNSRILSVPTSGVNSSIVGHETFGCWSTWSCVASCMSGVRRFTSAGTMYSSSDTSHQSLSARRLSARLIAMSTSSCAARAYSASHIVSQLCQRETQQSWNNNYFNINDAYDWRGSSVVTISVFGRQTFPALCPLYGWQTTTLWVNCPLWVSHLNQLCLPSIWDR